MWVLLVVKAKEDFEGKGREGLKNSYEIRKFGFPGGAWRRGRGAKDN